MSIDQRSLPPPAAGRAPLPGMAMAGPRRLLRAAAASGIILAGTGVAPAQFFSLGKGNPPLEVYDRDVRDFADPARRVTLLDRLHFIPIGTTGAFLTLDAELREQAWSLDNAAFGLRQPARNSYDLQRLLGSVALHVDPHLAAFVQLGRFDSFDRITPSTTERDRGRVQQGFVELKERVGPAEVTLRGGRQEVALGSGRFVWVNDSSNARTTQDGVRVNAVLAGDVSLDAVYTRPVNPVLQPFGDFDQHGGAFGAVYLSEGVGHGIHLDQYVFTRRNLGGQYSGLTGNEDRQTVGGRLWGGIEHFAGGRLLYDGDFAYQFGTFNGRPISAIGTSTRLLYAVPRFTYEPGVQLQGSYFSGGGGTGTRVIRTFSAPFPRPTLLNYIGLNTLENLVEAYPAAVVTPAPNLSFRFGPEFLWRASVDDAVYISRSTPLPATMAARDKASFIGTNLIGTAQWNPAPDVNVFAEYLHDFAGPAIALAGGHSVNAGVIQVTYRP